MLSMNSVKMSTLEKNANNCTLTAVTRILKYYKGKGYKQIPSKLSDIYKDVRKIAVGYGYTPTNGIGFTKINNLAQDVLRNYGYKDSYSKGIYVWSFSDQIKKEIDNKRPVIMNIARGYYGNHSVTVCGYKTYTVNGTTHHMIAVYDGWKAAIRYIDYEAFANDLISSGFGSFNTVIVK